MLRSRATQLFLLVAIPLACMQACASQTRTNGTDGAGGTSTSGPTTTTTSTSSSSAVSSSSTGPCHSAADCSGMTDACNTGACVNGVCGKIPANELGACDDGKMCTDFDTCMNGTCVGGTPHVCQPISPCGIPTCDVATDKCVDTPGPDGMQCDDGDPCTTTSTCMGGQCVGTGMVDCSFLNSVCGVGVCDKVNGCVAMPQNDGTPCDDNLFCTVNDVCTNGVCGGSPNPCGQPNNACMVPSCDEANKTCTAVPGNNGGKCDDGNDCTVGETCSNGVCSGGVAGNQGAACDDHNGCTTGTHCNNGVCGGAQGMVNQCISGDQCCPAGCKAPADNDCIDLTGVFAQYAQDNRNVYIWKTPVPCADLSQYTNFCQNHGLKWWSAKSQADAQQLITFAYNLDMTHTWIQVYNTTVTDMNASTVGGFNVVVDGKGCVESDTGMGWSAFRKWACSFCNPASNAQQMDNNQSCCWDKGHPYDWFVCED